MHDSVRSVRGAIFGGNFTQMRHIQAQEKSAKWSVVKTTRRLKGLRLILPAQAVFDLHSSLKKCCKKSFFSSGIIYSVNTVHFIKIGRKNPVCFFKNIKED
jgi:hypothetical protein